MTPTRSLAQIAHEADPDRPPGQTWEAMTARQRARHERIAHAVTLAIRRREAAARAARMRVTTRRRRLRG